MVKSDTLSFREAQELVLLQSLNKLINPFVLYIEACPSMFSLELPDSNFAQNYSMADHTKVRLYSHSYTQLLYAFKNSKTN